MSANRWVSDGIYIVATSAQTPVGRSSLKAAAAVRCNLSAYAEHPFMIDRRGEPMVVARADWLPINAPAKDRMIRLGADAALEVAHALTSQLRGSSIELLTAMSATTLESEAARHSVASSVLSELYEVGCIARGQVYAEGNAIGVYALARAIEHLRAGTSEFSMVLGVDSFLAPETLEAVDYAGRLHSVNETWGFTPGEAAGAVVLTTGRVLERTGLKPLARIAAIATCSESKLQGSPTVCIGEGLSQAFHSAISKDEKVCHSYCDLNGEIYRAEEFGFAICRTGEGFTDAGSFCAAAQNWGDVGTASVPLQIALATSAWIRGFAKGQDVLCWSSSGAMPLRGAVRLKSTLNSAEAA